MSQLPAPVRLDEEQRLVMVQGAARTERANRPRFMLLFGVLAIVGSTIFLAVQGAKAGSARARVSNEETTAREVIKLVAELQATRGTDLIGDAAGKSDVSLSRLTSYATEAGLTAVVGSEDNDPRSAPPGYERKQLKFKISSQPASALLAWISRASKEDGIELSLITISPGTGTPEGQPRWNADVTFLKWRRKP
ncbi:MAG: hypothetical protein ACREJO_10930 [Phycisphaerales bacterium]